MSDFCPYCGFGPGYTSSLPGPYNNCCDRGQTMEPVVKAAEEARKHLVNLVGIRDGGVRKHERKGKLGALHALCDAVDVYHEALEESKRAQSR